MLNQPEVHDDWAKGIASLARRGEGRTPFTITGGGLLVSVEMARVSPVAPYLVIPVQIDGEDGLAMVQTNKNEVVIDAPGKADPSWVSISLGDHFEVTDVPALAQDLSGISRELGAPIKALLGMNLLRHLNVTIDYKGHQFVARTYAAPPPPNATRVNLYYLRGGMFLSTTFGANDGARSALFVDSSQRFPIVLDEHGWAKAGITANDLKFIPGDPDQKLKEGVVPMLRLGAFDLPHLPGVFGPAIADADKDMKFDIDGLIGTPILANYRITFSDGGRMMWLEDDSELEALLNQGPPGPTGAPLGSSPTNATEPEEGGIALPPMFNPTLGPDPSLLLPSEPTHAGKPAPKH